MNKRIEALISKTDSWCNVNFPSDWLNRVDEFLPLWNEKFAELIVQEAIAVVNQRYMGDNNREDMEVRRCVSGLKEHFGIE